MTDELMAALRKKCVKDVKNTIGNIRYDKIYSFQNQEFEDTEDDDEADD